MISPRSAAALATQAFAEVVVAIGWFVGWAVDGLRCRFANTTHEGRRS